jgi:aminoglycoside phosphotransferase (APT) family kinase protein
MTQMLLDKTRLLRELPELCVTYLGREPQGLKHLGGGSFGIAFRCDFSQGEPIVLKACRVPGMNETEAFQLRLLREHTHVPMPEVLFTAEQRLSGASGEPAGALGWLGMTLIPGHDALTRSAFLIKPKAVRRQFAQAVADGMLGWHNTEGPAFGFVQNPGCNSWPAFYRTIVDTVLAALPTLGIAQGQKETILAATARFDDIVSYSGTPRLIHGDLNLMNIMADKALRLTGFIDPFNSVWGDPDYDLFQLRALWSDWYGLLGAYRRHLRLTHEQEQRNNLKLAYYAAVNEALAFLRSGRKFEPNHILCDRRLRSEMKRAGLNCHGG